MPNRPVPGWASRAEAADRDGLHTNAAEVDDLRPRSVGPGMGRPALGSRENALLLAVELGLGEDAGVPELAEPCQLIEQVVR